MEETVKRGWSPEARQAALAARQAGVKPGKRQRKTPWTGAGAEYATEKFGLTGQLAQFMGQLPKAHLAKIDVDDVVVHNKASWSKFMAGQPKHEQEKGYFAHFYEKAGRSGKIELHLNQDVGSATSQKSMLFRSAGRLVLGEMSLKQTRGYSKIFGGKFTRNFSHSYNMYAIGAGSRAKLMRTEPLRYKAIETVFETMKTGAVDIIKVTVPKDVVGLNDKTLLSFHYLIHSAWRRREQGKAEWAGMKTEQDFIDFHGSLVAEMGKRGISHLNQDDLDETVKDQIKTTKTESEVPEEIEHWSSPVQDWFEKYPMKLDWLRDAAALSRHIRGSSVVELGCGAGKFIEVLGLSGLVAKGIDSDEEAVAVGLVIGAPIEQAEALEWLKSQEDGSWDSVISMHFLEHHPDYHEVLKECFRVCVKMTAHVVPLASDIEGHLHVWKDELDLKRALVDVVEASVLGLFDGTALIKVEKTVSKSAAPFAALDTFMEIPSYVSLVGSSVKQDDKTEYDVVVRDQNRNLNIELQLRNQFRALGKEMELDFIYNPSGPHGLHIPLYDRVAVKKANLEVIEVKIPEMPKARATNSPLAYCKPAKPAVSFDSVEEMWRDWGEKHISEGISLEWKCDGFRAHLAKKGDDMRVYTNNPNENYAKRFPKTLSEFKKLPDVVIDCECLIYDAKGQPLSREQIVTHLTRGKQNGFDDSLVIFWAFDCLYWEGKWILNETYRDRRGALDKVLVGRAFRHIKKMPRVVATTKAEFLKGVEAAKSQSASEGVVAKVMTSLYPDTGATRAWAKHKVVYDIAVQVTKVNPTEANTYTYDIAIQGLKGELISAAHTMATGLKVNVGDILEIRVLKAWKKDDGTWSFLLPRVIEQRTDLKKPQGIARAEFILKETTRRGEKSEIRHSLFERVWGRLAGLVRARVGAEKLAPASATIGQINRGDIGKWVMQIHSAPTHHVDFRLGITRSNKKNAAFAGFQMYIPSKLRRVTEDDWKKTLEDTGKAVRDHLLGGGTLAGSYKTATGGPQWLDMGKEKPEIFERGWPGASKSKEGYMLAFDWGTYEAGPVLEGHHSGAFLLKGQHIKDRWFVFVGVKKKEMRGGAELAAGEGRVWLFRLLATGKAPSAVKKEEEEGGPEKGPG